MWSLIADQRPRDHIEVILYVAYRTILLHLCSSLTRVQPSLIVAHTIYFPQITTINDVSLKVM